MTEEQLKSLSPDELARREAQRAKREAALAARADGKTYTAAQELKRKARSLTKLKSREREKEVEKERRLRAKGVTVTKDRNGRLVKPGAAPAPGSLAKGDGKSAPAKDVQVVVLPLYFKKEAEGQQKRNVITASRVASEYLRAHGFAVWVDLDESLMPGHKFKKWEEQGVRVRVEIGPRDVEKSVAHAQCVVSIVTGVGTVADRETVEVGSEAFFARVEKGAGKPKLEPRTLNLPDVEELVKPNAEKAPAVGGGRKQGRAARPQGVKTVFADSGDAEDDFEIDAAKLAGAKKQRRK